MLALIFIRINHRKKMNMLHQNIQYTIILTNKCIFEIWIHIESI